MGDAVVIRDGMGRLVDPKKVPELLEQLLRFPVQDEWANRALQFGATCWLDADGRHIRFAHACRERGWSEETLVYGRPIGTKGDGGGWCAMQEEPLTVAPSVTCDLCGFHWVFANGRFGG